jgi:plasmid maintenance system antidote protein VapI
MSKQIHHGELIKKTMKEKGIKASWLAEQIHYSKKIFIDFLITFV